MDKPCLLISDVDGTLLGDDAALREFSNWIASRRDRVKLVYNSGRMPDSVRGSVEFFAMPMPDAIIGGVGTEIRDARGDHLNGWLDDCPAWRANVVLELLGAKPELELQPHEFLSPHKISYFGNDLPDEYVQQLRQELEEAGCLADLIYSSQRNLDVLPRGANKGTASAWLAKQWGFDKTHVFVSGDTGNDLALFKQGFRGIVVGNALPELKSLCTGLVYHAEAPYAAGVLEGLQHWLGEG